MPLGTMSFDFNIDSRSNTYANGVQIAKTAICPLHTFVIYYYSKLQRSQFIYNKFC